MRFPRLLSSPAARAVRRDGAWFCKGARGRDVGASKFVEVTDACALGARVVSLVVCVGFSEVTSQRLVFRLH